MKDWLENKKIEIFDDEIYLLIRDIKINSPSMAGKIAKGTNAENGWDIFKNKKGETLDQVYRKNK